MHEFPPPWWPLSNYGYAGVPVSLITVTALALLLSLRVSGSTFSCVTRMAMLAGIPWTAMLWLSRSAPKVFAPGRDLIILVLVGALSLICLQGVLRAFITGKRNGRSWNSLVGVVLGVAAVFVCSPPQRSAAREAAFRTQCKNNLKQIGLALHNYHDMHRMFPTPVQPAFDRSWRVTLLPFMEQAKLYERYDQDATWDSTSNLPLTLEVVRSLDCPGRPFRLDDQRRFLAAYTAVTGPGAAFEAGQYTRILDIADGTSNTLMVTESCGKKIIWTQPLDVFTETDALQVNAPGSNLHQSDGVASSYHLGGANVLMADGSVKYLSQNVDQEILKKVISRSGEQYGPETLEHEF